MQVAFYKIYFIATLLAKHAALEVPHVKRETHLLFGLGHFSIPVQSFRIKTKSRNILLCLEIPYLQFPIIITIQVFKNLAIYFLNKLLIMIRDFEYYMIKDHRSKSKGKAVFE